MKPTRVLYSVVLGLFAASLADNIGLPITDFRWLLLIALISAVGQLLWSAFETKDE